jgi:hypothetical protein
MNKQIVEYYYDGIILSNIKEPLKHPIKYGWGSNSLSYVKESIFKRCIL